MAKQDDQNQDKGFALVAVLIFILLIAGIMIPFTVNAHIRLLATNNTLGKLKADMIAESAIELLAHKLADAGNENRSAFSQDTMHCAYEKNGYLHIRITEHNGLVDLNFASHDLLGIGMQSLGLANDQLQKITSAITRFRSRPALSKPTSGLKADFGYKEGAFEAVSELHDFELMRQYSIPDMEAVFTVSKNSATINPQKSPPGLKTSLETAISENGSLPFIINGSAGRWAATIEVYVTTARGISSNRRKVLLASGSGTQTTLVSLISDLEIPDWSSAHFLGTKPMCQDLFSDQLQTVFAGTRP